MASAIWPLPMEENGKGFFLFVLFFFGSCFSPATLWVLVVPSLPPEVRTSALCSLSLISGFRIYTYVKASWENEAMRRREGGRMWMDIHLPLPLFFWGGRGHARASYSLSFLVVCLHPPLRRICEQL